MKNLQITVIVPEMKKSVLLVFEKVCIKNQRDGVDRTLDADWWVLWRIRRMWFVQRTIDFRAAPAFVVASLCELVAVLVAT